MIHTHTRLTASFQDKCKKLNSLNMVFGVRSKPNHTSKTAKIILKLSVCVFFEYTTYNSHFKLFDYMASNTDVVKKTIL